MHDGYDVVCKDKFTLFASEWNQKSGPSYNYFKWTVRSLGLRWINRVRNYHTLRTLASTIVCGHRLILFFSGQVLSACVLLKTTCLSSAFGKLNNCGYIVIWNFHQLCAQPRRAPVVQRLHACCCNSTSDFHLLQVVKMIYSHYSDGASRFTTFTFFLDLWFSLAFRRPVQLRNISLAIL